MTNRVPLATGSGGTTLPDSPRRFESVYVRARDGIDLALDVYLPSNDPDLREVPVIMTFTPYYRRFADHPSSETLPGGIKADVAFFTSNGYGVVVVDVRGTGASFGSRPAFRSPQERQDYVDVVDWVVAQEWSNGRIGAIGWSYSGAAADFLASTGHPAVKAVIPGFAVWDTYTDMFYPGGLLSRTLTNDYAPMIRSLDVDDRSSVATYALFAGMPLTGPAPVDSDADGERLSDAIADHLTNFDMRDHIRDVWCRDAPLALGSDLSAMSISPITYAAQTAPDTAVLAVSGWYDGFGYGDAAVRRFHETASRRRHLMIGPWDHCAFTNVSPFEIDKSSQAPGDYLRGVYLDFFDHYLRERDNGFSDRAPVQYFTLGAGEWTAAETFPPPGLQELELHLSEHGRLALQPEIATSSTEYRVDPSTSTGKQTRHQLGCLPLVENYYSDWAGRSDRLSTFTTPPAVRATEITGYVELSVTMSTTAKDGGLFAYLEDVAPDGEAHYITEGVLRLGFAGSSVTEVPGTPNRRNFLKSDLKPIEPGATQVVDMMLQPISWRLAEGHQLRLALGGADQENIRSLPVGEVPELVFFHGGAHRSTLRLPLSVPAWD